MLLPLPGGPESLLLVLLALLFEACVGDSRIVVRLLPRPGDLAADAMRGLDRRLNRIERSDGARRLRGTLSVVALLLAAVVAGLAFTVVARFVPHGWPLEVLIAMRCLSLRAPWIGLRNVLEALEGGAPEAARLEAGRSAVAPLTDRQVASLDRHGVVRAALEGMARQLDRRVVGPVLVYALFGLPALLAWSVLEGAVRVVGPPVPRYRSFGRTARGLAGALGALSARVTAVLLALAALFVPRAKAGSALKVALRAAPGHPNGATAWPEAALAGALGLALSGPRREGETTVSLPWLGDGRARAVPSDLRPAMVLFNVAVLLAALLAAGLGLVALRFA